MPIIGEYHRRFGGAAQYSPTVPRGGNGASGQKTEIAYLAPHERSGHDIALAVELHAGVAIEEIRCPSHGNTMTAGRTRSALCS